MMGRELPHPFLISEPAPLSVSRARDLSTVFWVPGDFYFASTVDFIKPAACLELKQNSRKYFLIKVGVFLARSGMNMGVWVN